MVGTGGTGVMLRRATSQDLAALERLEEVFPGDRIPPPALRRFIASRSATVWVAELEGAVVGDALVLYRSGRRAQLHSLAVALEHRGKGLGRELLERAEAGARREGCVEMRLEVRPDNAPAIALYRSAGYDVVGRRAGYYHDGSPAIRMRKHLME